MKSILIKLFVQNWQRKLISLILAIVIWLMINHSISIGTYPVKKKGRDLNQEASATQNPIAPSGTG